MTHFFYDLFSSLPDVPRNFSVNLATKTSVLLTWEFPESSNPYRFTVCPQAVSCYLHAKYTTYHA